MISKTIKYEVLKDDRSDQGVSHISSSAQPCGKFAHRSTRKECVTIVDRYGDHRISILVQALSYQI